MPEPYDTLIRVQDHDTALDQLRHRIDTLPERAERLAVEQRRVDLAKAADEVRAQVDDLATRQRRLEEQIAEAAARRHQIEKRMESGEVSASRDLQAMDLETHHLVDRQSQFEEEELLLVEEEEPFDTLLAEHEATAAELTAEAARLEAAIELAEQEIRAAIAAEEVLRAEQAADLPAELAERYERLRSQLGGVGAARLVGNRCDGCHLTLPSVDVERIHRLPADEIALCTQCDRILVR